VRALRVLKALAHPTRLEILEQLWEEPQPFSWLMRRIGLDSRCDSGSFVWHLGRLEDAGLIAKEVEVPRYCLTDLGRYVYALISTLEKKIGGEEVAGEGGEG